MKRFNLTKTILTGTLVALLAVGVQSCKKDEEDPDRNAFLGNYSVTTGTITCGVTGNGTITSGTAVVISENSAGEEKISISIGAAISVVGTVSGSTVTIDNQTLSGFTYTGTGAINDNTFTLSLSEFDGSVPETCVYSFSATK